MTETDDAGESADRRARHQELAKELLAAGSSYGEVAAEVGVVKRTIGRWMTEPEFRRDVSERRAQRLAEVTGQLATSALDVVGQVRLEVFEGETSADRVRAAALYMKLLVQLRHDAELEERLREVERRVGLVDTTDNTTQEGGER